MRFVLALLAILGLLTAPLTAAAAQASCGHEGPGAMPAGVHTSGADPCCDHSGQQGKKADVVCAQACATSCGVAVALASSPYSVVFATTQAAVAPSRIGSPHPYEPPGLKRPPKSIA